MRGRVAWIADSRRREMIWTPCASPAVVPLESGLKPAYDGPAPATLTSLHRGSMAVLSFTGPVAGQAPPLAAGETNGAFSCESE